jgi:hypothetical protein
MRELFIGWFDYYAQKPYTWEVGHVTCLGTGRDLHGQSA